jgi:hypothetical protein
MDLIKSLWEGKLKNVVLKKLLRKDVAPKRAVLPILMVEGCYRDLI